MRDLHDRPRCGCHTRSGPGWPARSARKGHGDGIDAEHGRAAAAVEAIWNRGELDAADALFAPDYVNHGGLIPDLVRGPEAIKVSVALYRAAFPGFPVAVDELRGDGETAVLRWTARGRHRNSRGGPVAAAGRGSLTGTTRCRLADGKIAESWTSWDAPAALRRLGLAPPPEPAGA